MLTVVFSMYTKHAVERSMQRDAWVYAQAWWDLGRSVGDLRIAFGLNHLAAKALGAN